MATPSTVGRGIEQLACQRLVDHLRVETNRGVRSFPLSELAESTGLDPRTVEQAMARLAEHDSHTVDRQTPDYGELRWHVRGGSDGDQEWNTDIWTVRE